MLQSSRPLTTIKAGVKLCVCLCMRVVRINKQTNKENNSCPSACIEICIYSSEVSAKWARVNLWTNKRNLLSLKKPQFPCMRAHNAVFDSRLRLVTLIQKDRINACLCLLFVFAHPSDRLGCFYDANLTSVCLVCLCVCVCVCVWVSEWERVTERYRLCRVVSLNRHCKQGSAEIHS